MVLRFFLFAGLFLFASCYDAKFDNPDDPESPNYIGNRLSSSSLVGHSSSSADMPLSSAAELSSSSNVLPSSSSVAKSSSSSGKILYFYPPDMAKWISGGSYIYDMEHAPKALELVPTMCGWYRTTIPAGVDAFQIWLGVSGVDKIGPLGKQSDDPKYEGGTNYYQLGGFYVASVFGSSNTVYFIPDELDPNVTEPVASATGSSGWHTSLPSYIPTSGSRCNSNLATFIYDTDIRGTGF